MKNRKKQKSELIYSVYGVPYTGIRVHTNMEASDLLDLEILSNGNITATETIDPNTESILEIAESYFPKDEELTEKLLSQQIVDEDGFIIDGPNLPITYTSITWQFDNDDLEKVVEENFKTFPLNF